jgi:hypothetical protein
MKVTNRDSENALMEREGHDWVEIVRQQVASLRFGVVLITVHESNVVQIEKTEKLRFSQKEQTGDQKTGSTTIQSRTH